MSIRSAGQYLAWALIASGAALRVLFYIEGPSLRLDEARLALAIASRSYLQLFPPLDHGQSAPLLFLWAERATVSLLGVNEFALRLLPLLAGIAILAVMPVVARPLVGTGGAIVATGLAAAAPVLMSYSNEAKQYTTEALVTLGLIGLAIRWLDVPDVSRRIHLIAAGAVAVWLSAPAIFVLASILGAGLLKAWRSDGAIRRSCGAAGLVWTASFALAFALVYGAASQDPYMNHFWAPAFLGLGEVDLLDLTRNVGVGVLAAYATYPYDVRAVVGEVPLLIYALVTIGLVAAGCVQVFRRRGPSALALCLGPFLVTFAASAVGLYPVALRPMLFAIPLHLLLVGGGVAALGERLWSGRPRLPSAALGVVVGLPMLTITLHTAGNRDVIPAVRPLVLELRARRKPGEAVYVFTRTIPVWTFYTTDWAKPDTARLRWFDTQSRPGGPAFENSPSRGRRVGAAEGEDLVFESRSGPELLGLPTGIEWTAFYEPRQNAPDSGWAEHEARRITRAARPAVWVLMSAFGAAEAGLLRAVEAHGGPPTLWRVQGNAVLARFEIGKAAEALPKARCLRRP